VRNPRTPSGARHKRAAWRIWLLAAGLTLANPLLHKPLSDVCDWARSRWGFASYNLAALIAIPCASLLAVSPMLIRRRTALVRPATLLKTLILCAVSVAAQRWLLVANIELIHLPQYAVLAVVLLAAGVDAPSAYLLSIAAGVLDETYQHLVIYAHVAGTYFDVNDMVLNAIGAAWGVALFAGTFEASVEDAPRFIHFPESKTERRWRLSRGLGGLMLLAAFLIALWLDPPRFTPFLSPTTSGRAVYRVMSCAEGIVACTLLWGLIRVERRRVPAVDHARLAWT
jgi:hypothetical protein